MEQVHQVKIEKGRTRWVKSFWEPSLLHLSCIKSYLPHVHLFMITPATVHVFECVFYIFLLIYAGSQKLVLLLFLLPSSPLFFLFLRNRGLIGLVVLRMRQLEVMFVSLHLRLPELL